MRIFSFIILLLLLIVGVSFAVLNHSPVSFNYYFAAKEISLSLLLAFSLGIGILLGFFVTLSSMIRIKAENYKIRHKLKSVEQEVLNLRAVPIKGP